MFAVKNKLRLFSRWASIRFKQVNDQLSHAQGDECLVTIVRTIADVLRHKGKLYRVGGDEFCVMLRNFCVDEAGVTAERIRKSIKTP